ncbi:hypothetical protein JW948_16810 [bacterium]|nr:hypothetical protein [bacterium]
MTLSDWGNLALVCQAIFFVVSLWILLVELRNNTNQVRSSNIHSLVELMTPIMLRTIENRDLTELCLKGAKSLESLDDVDRERFLNMLIWWLVIYENIYYQWKNGYLRTENFQPWASFFLEILGHYNICKYWEHFESQFNPVFMDYVKNEFRCISGSPPVHSGN